jgi:hypothetical protein
VNVITHQTVTENLRAFFGCATCQQVKIAAAIAGRKEDQLPIGATLCDVVGNAWNNDARPTGHNQRVQSALLGPQEKMRLSPFDALSPEVISSFPRLPNHDDIGNALD